MSKVKRKSRRRRNILSKYIVVTRETKIKLPDDCSTDDINRLKTELRLHPMLLPSLFKGILPESKLVYDVTVAEEKEE